MKNLKKIDIDKLALFVAAFTTVLGMAAMALLVNLGMTMPAYIVGFATVCYEVAFIVIDMIFDMKIAKVIFEGDRP